MKKKLLALITVLAVMLCLAGCGTHITSISLPEELEVNVGETVDAIATFAADKEDISAEELAKKAAELELVWASSDDAVAIVDAGGVITGVSGGNTTVTVATADGTMSATVKIVVNVPLEAIKAEDVVLNTLSDDAVVNYTLVPENVMVENVTISIADKSIAVVSDGKVTPVAAGQTELTITCGEIAKTVAVKVLQAPVELSAEDVSVEVGKTATIEVDTGLAEGLEAEVGDKYTYKVSDEKIATVDENGVVTGVAAGKTEVQVTNILGQDCTVEVEVTEPVRAATSNSGGANGGRTQGQNSGAVDSGSTGSAGNNGGGNQAPAPTPDPTPITPPAPPAQTVTCSYCGGAHDVSACPSHYHGNENDAGRCPVCGFAYSVVVDPSTAPGYADGAGGE